MACSGDSCGMIVRHKEKVLMLERRVGELGWWACPAGHREMGEFPLDCARRELLEEVGVEYEALYNVRLVLSGTLASVCRSGTAAHKWWIYDSEAASPHFQHKEPAKHRAVGWFHPSEIEKMKLEPVWRVILEAAGILKKAG